MLKCCHLLSNILLLASILILRLSTSMMVSHQEASGIAAKDASSKPWMTKHSHLHVQEEVKVMQMTEPGRSTLNVLNYKYKYSPPGMYLSTSTFLFGEMYSSTFRVLS